MLRAQHHHHARARSAAPTWPLMRVRQSRPRAPLVVRAQAPGVKDDAAAPPPLRARLGAAAAAGLVFLSGVGVGAGGALALSPQQQQPQQQSAASTTTTTTTTSAAFAPPATKDAPPLSMSPPSTPQADSVALARRKGLSAEEQATIRIFEEATPAVVNITNLQRVRLSGGGGGRGGGFYGSGGFSSNNSGGVALAPIGTGSGFLWPVEAPKKGVVVTNYHVVKGASALKVTLFDSTTYDARILGVDPEKDTAVLQLLDVPAEKRLQTVTLGSSSDLQVGQRVVALGNPFGLDHSLSAGIVSGLNREIGEGVGGVPLRNMVQTDASIGEWVVLLGGSEPPGLGLTRPRNTLFRRRAS